MKTSKADAASSQNVGRFQKISIPYNGRHLGIPRERGVTWTGILKAFGGGGGVTQSVNFQRGRQQNFHLKSLIC